MITLERRDKMPVTVNAARRTRTMRLVNNELKEWRAWAKAEADGLPPMVGPVTVRVTHLRKTRASMPDVGAPILAVKAVIDGVVDAGVLGEDGPAVVARLTFLAPEVVGWHGLRVEILERAA